MRARPRRTSAVPWQRPRSTTDPARFPRSLQTIFFIPYALAEPLTNVLLKRLSPRLFLSTIMILWGACMLAQGFCTGFKSLMATRFLLGLTEASPRPDRRLAAVFGALTLHSSDVLLLRPACSLEVRLEFRHAALPLLPRFRALTEKPRRRAVNMYLSCWYKRTEFGVRGSVFFSAATAAGAFGGLLAALISKMNGVGGRRGWEWIVSPQLSPLLVAERAH